MTTTSEKDNNLRELEELRQKLKEQEEVVQGLRDRLNIYEAAAKGSNDGLWDWDIERNSTFVSEAWKSMLGHSVDDDATNEDWMALIHPQDQAIVVERFRDFLAGRQEVYDQEFRMKHADGSYRWMHSRAKALRDGNGKTLRVSGSLSDITERKKAAEFIKRSEAKYRNLFENSLVAMFRMNAKDGTIVDANQKLMETLGDQDLVGKCFYDYLMLPLDIELFKNNLEENKGIENLEVQLKTSTGDPLWISFSGAHYLDDKEVDCVLKDISQTKENLLELQKVNFELDSFVYHASHDLRSPLRSVLGLIDLYRMEESQSVREECIEKIESSVKRLDLLVMDLLSISRNDRVNEPTREINFMNEVNSSISSYYNASNTTNLEIITKVIQPVKFISDLTRVRIILNNLISNAIKYRSFHKERGLLLIEIVVNEKEAVIKIEDNGEGIEESKLPHIFDMFYRATEKSEGSGLGLYIVKKVADKLNATIEVDSIELEGTTFTVTIPNSTNQ